MKQVLERMNRGKFFGWFYRILGLVILINLLCNNDDAFGEIAGWIGIAALAILTDNSVVASNTHPSEQLPDDSVSPFLRSF